MNRYIALVFLILLGIAGFILIAGDDNSLKASATEAMRNLTQSQIQMP